VNYSAGTRLLLTAERAFVVAALACAVAISAAAIAQFGADSSALAKLPPILSRGLAAQDWLLRSVLDVSLCSGARCAGLGPLASCLLLLPTIWIGATALTILVGSALRTLSRLAAALTRNVVRKSMQRRADHGRDDRSCP